MDSKVRNTNFFTVHGWMLTELNLKGNDLLVYAIIYGFSQTDGQYFCGSLQYIADWTNSTRQGVIKNIEHLIELGLLEKIITNPTNRYKAIVPATVNRVEQVCKQSLQEDSKQSLHNNININNITNNIDKYNKSKEIISQVQDIIKYFNSVCSTNFKSNTVATRKLIKRHLDEGFTIDDFKKVIDLKYLDWGKNPKKFTGGQMSNEYLRPATLFGDKFESYVYEALARTTSENFVSTSSEIDPDRSDYTF